MSQRRFLGQIVGFLDAAGVPYMLCGSHGSSFYGEPRATADIDIVIDPGRESLTRFLGALPPEFYASSGAALGALDSRGMFNVIDRDSGSKADLVIRKQRAFSVTEFSRRRPATILDMELYLASPEDVILSKLEWGQLGESDRQIRDAAGVIAVQGSDLDDDYLDHWAHELGVENELARARREASSG